MTSEDAANDERWQYLMRSMDPVANLNALADVWREAAAASERVVEGTVSQPGDQPDSAGDGSPPSAGPRDFRLDVERSVDQMADAAKRFFSQMPWSMSMPTQAAPPGATVAVVDGVGTTEITGPAGDGELWSTEVVRHDGASIPASAVTFWDTPSYGNGDGEPAERAVIVKVAIDGDTDSGVYHGQILCRGQLGFVLPLEIKVVGSTA